jgi:hypothetical protein
VEPPFAQPVLDGAPAQAALKQLLAGKDAVLSAREPPDAFGAPPVDHTIG